MNIDNLNFKNGLFLAPMAGVTDVGFRAIAKFFGAELTWTEMVSAKGLFYGDKKPFKTSLNCSFIEKFPEIASNKTALLLLSEEIEDIKGVQIFGNETEFMSKACQNSLIDKFNLIDINMGCPAPKIVKNGEGSALMENIEKARKIIESCVASSSKPVTVKFRKGYKTNNAVSFAKMCERAGASAITIHSRLMTEGYGGQVDYDIVTEVKKSVKIPVIGSGDVRDINSYKKMLSTGVDAVMVGRGSLGNQTIFKELSEYINKRKISLVKFIQKGDFFKDILTEEDLSILEKNEDYIKYLCAKKHLLILRKYYRESFLIKYMRKHMLWYANGLKIDTQTKQKLALSNDLSESLNILKDAVL